MLSDKYELGMMPESLLGLLEPLIRTLTNVIKMLQDLQHWPYLKRLILSGSIRQNISNAHEDIDQACRLFHVGILIDIRRNQGSTRDTEGSMQPPLELRKRSDTDLIDLYFGQITPPNQILKSVITPST